jgi:hypothetical protein
MGPQERQRAARLSFRIRRMQDRDGYQSAWKPLGAIGYRKG